MKLELEIKRWGKFGNVERGKRQPELNPEVWLFKTTSLNYQMQVINSQIKRCVQL